MEEFRIQNYKPTKASWKQPKGLRKRQPSFQTQTVWHGISIARLHVQTMRLPMWSSSAAVDHVSWILEDVGALKTTGIQILTWFCELEVNHLSIECICYSWWSVNYFVVWKNCDISSLESHQMSLYSSSQAECHPYVSSRKPSHSLQRSVTARHAPMFQLRGIASWRHSFGAAAAFLVKSHIIGTNIEKTCNAHRGIRELCFQQTIVETHLFFSA